MKIAELTGDKTVQALAKRLLKESGASIAVNELVAALVRLNPHLSQIERLEEGTPILLPPNLVSAGENAGPLAGVATALVRQAEGALQELRAALRASAEQAGDEAEQAQAWLKGETAKAIVREVSDLKDVFSKTATAAGKVRKEQIALFTEQEKLLRKLQAELAEFQKPVRPSGTKQA